MAAVENPLTVFRGLVKSALAEITEANGYWHTLLSQDIYDGTPDMTQDTGRLRMYVNAPAQDAQLMGLSGGRPRSMGAVLEVEALLDEKATMLLTRRERLAIDITQGVMSYAPLCGNKYRWQSVSVELGSSELDRRQGRVTPGRAKVTFVVELKPILGA